MSYALGSYQVSLLQIAFAEAGNSTATVGAWSRAYELLFAMISKNSSGQVHVSNASLASVTFSKKEDEENGI